jgi:hypothetical protein
MKVYILHDDDFARLLAEIDRDPSYGRKGGSSQEKSQKEMEIHREAHGFFNYVVRAWIDSVVKSKYVGELDRHTLG